MLGSAFPSFEFDIVISTENLSSKHEKHDRMEGWEISQYFIKHIYKENFLGRA